MRKCQICFELSSYWLCRKNHCSASYCEIVKSVRNSVVLNWAAIDYVEKKCHRRFRCQYQCYCNNSFTVVLSLLCLIYVPNRKASFSMFVEISAIFVMVKTETTWCAQDAPDDHNNYILAICIDKRIAVSQPNNNLPCSACEGYLRYLVLPLSNYSCIDSPAPLVSLLFTYEGLRSQHTNFLREGRLTRKNAFFMSYIDVNIYSVSVIKVLA